MNYLWDNQFRLFRTKDPGEFGYSDGVEVEQRLLDVVSKASDRSTFSDELAEAISDWPSEYHLSRLRHCLVRPLNIAAGQKILELGCGCGAITRYLGETGASVVAVEGSLARARVTAERCRDLSNVRVVVDDLLRFQTDERFDFVLLVGVLEYAAMFSNSDSPYQDYLKAVTRFLAPGGRVVIAIENQLGLKYFNGCGEDHIGTPFFGIQDLYGDRTPRTFGRPELIRLLSAARLAHTRFFYPFPDYKLPSVVLSEEALSDPHFDAVDLLARSHGRDYAGSPYRSFDDALAFSVIANNGLLAELSNSFLVVATVEAKAEAPAAELAHGFAIHRAPQFCTHTRFLRANGAIKVAKDPLTSVPAQPIDLPDGERVRHVLGETPYRRGRQLLWSLLKARSRSDDQEAVIQALAPWMKFLLDNARIPAGNVNDIEGHRVRLSLYELPGKFLDCTPANLIDTGAGLTPIDLEWQSDRDIPLGWVVARAILWCLGSGLSSSDNLGTISEIVEGLCKQFELTVHKADVDSWLKSEAQFQSVVLGHSCRDLTTVVPSSGLHSFLGEFNSLSNELVVSQERSSSLSEQVGDLLVATGKLSQELTERTEEVAVLNAARADADEQLLSQNRTIQEQQEQIAIANGTMAAAGEQLATLNRKLEAEQEQVAALTQTLAAKEKHIGEQDAAIESWSARLHESNSRIESFSWKVTAPLRSLRASFPGLATVVRHGMKAAYGVLTLQTHKQWRRRKTARLLLQSGLFDPDYYLANNQDVRCSGRNPLVHYLSEGAQEGRRPNEYFDTGYYLLHNSDVAASGMNPLVHYLLVGYKEGREPSAEFSWRSYLAFNPDVRESGINPVSHFLKYGREEGRTLYPVSAAPTPLPDNDPQSQPSSTEIPDTKAAPSSRVDPPSAVGRATLLLQSQDHARRILVVDHAVPTPDTDSGSFRMFNLLKLLVETGISVTFGSHSDVNRRHYVEDLEKVGVEIVEGFADIRIHLERLGGRYSSVILSRPETAELYLALVRAYAPQAELSYDCVDLHYLRFRRAAELSPSPDLFQKVGQYYDLEGFCFTSADRVLAITKTEQELIQREWPGTRVDVLPNIHRVSVSQRPFEGRHGLVFIGGFDHEPNVDGVLWFTRKIFPLILQKIPSMHFTILGSKPRDVIRSLASRNVRVVGWVPDPIPYFSASRVFVAPLRYGAGMKGKIGHAMSNGLPVVTTGVGTEGMQISPDVQALVANDQQEFADRVIKLHTDHLLWERLQRQAAAHIDRNFSEAAVSKTLQRLFARESVPEERELEVSA